MGAAAAGDRLDLFGYLVVGRSFEMAQITPRSGFNPFRIQGNDDSEMDIITKSPLPMFLINGGDVLRVPDLFPDIADSGPIIKAGRAIATSPNPDCCLSGVRRALC